MAEVYGLRVILLYSFYVLDCCYVASVIGGFRNTYLGRQVVSSPRGQRAGMGSAGGLGERCELPERDLRRSSS